jgi:hypothetical protein
LSIGRNLITGTMMVGAVGAQELPPAKLEWLTDQPHTDVTTPGEGAIFTISVASASSTSSSARVMPGTSHLTWTGLPATVIIGRQLWVGPAPFVITRR